mmetsp:Transcript_16309/g.54619  ORF Transcript_16309/g.54619 Transcript_16309/m.54619 type:complete len:204 (+) Transcript_16309:1094-1705(+)
MDWHRSLPGDHERLELPHALLGDDADPDRSCQLRHAHHSASEHRVGYQRQGLLHVRRCRDRQRRRHVRPHADARPDLEARAQGPGGHHVRPPSRLPELRGCRVEPDRSVRDAGGRDQDQGPVRLREPEHARARVPLLAATHRHPPHLPPHPEQENDGQAYRRRGKRNRRRSGGLAATEPSEELKVRPTADVYHRLFILDSSLN